MDRQNKKSEGNRRSVCLPTANMLNLLHTVKYRYFIMQPMNVITLPVSLTVLGTIPMLRSHPAFTIPCFAVTCGSLFLTRMVRRKRLNDYLISVKYPFSRFSYLYQDVCKDKTRSHQMYEARETYLSQMRQALDNLPAGRYKTVTQPMFTRAICQSPAVTVIRKEKAYRKKSQPLVKRIYASFAGPNQSGRKKQFYYISFGKK